MSDALDLSVPPVAVRFVDQKIDESETDIPVSAGCQFWERVARKVVNTSARQHQNCAVGIHTHNLIGAPETQASELGNVLAAMQGLDYVRESEIAGIPVRNNASHYVVYEPLSEAENKPEVVILFVHAAQSLVLTEALQRVDGQIPPAMGRPACALVPQVSNSKKSAASFGCCGARVYVNALTDEITVWGLAGENLEAYAREIKILANGNAILTKFHEFRRQDIETGKEPSVQESLERLG